MDEETKDSQASKTKQQLELTTAKSDGTEINDFDYRKQRVVAPKPPLPKFYPQKQQRQESLPARAYIEQDDEP